MLRRRFAVLLFAAAALGFPPAVSADGDVVVRVRIAGAGSVTVEGDLRYEGKDTGGRAKRLIITVTGGSLRVAGERERGELSVTARSGRIKVGSYSYRGRMRIAAVDGKVQVVNVVDMENYLASVLGSEMGASWPREALKAQAVVARSYTLVNKRKSRNRAFDVDASVLSQVYKGIKGEDSRTRAAVDATRGEVLMVGGEIVEGFYHSACGGQTEAAAAIWQGSPAWFRSVKDPYCEAAPGYFWTHRIDYRELGRKLGVGPVTAVKVLDRGPGGRVLLAQFEGEGEQRLLAGDEVRRLLGYANLKSTFFEISVEGATFLFKGSGSGHGVGLCQWGARGQAEKGRTYRQILAHYFPAARLANP